MCQKTDTCLIHPSSFFEEETSHVFQILIRQSTSGVPWICRMPQGSRRSWPWQRRPWICPGLPECGPFWRGWGKNRGQSVIAGIGLCFNGDMKNMATHTTRWMDRVLDECFFFGLRTGCSMRGSQQGTTSMDRPDPGVPKFQVWKHYY